MMNVVCLLIVFSMFWFAITLLVVYLVYKFIIQPTRYWKELGIPHVSGWPIVGSFSETVVFRSKPFYELAKEFHLKFPNERYYGIYMFGRPALVIKDLDLLKEITVKNFDHFTDHLPVFPEEADALMGKNLFSMQGQRWREMRATLSPAFTSSKMRGMFVLMSECARNAVNYLVKESDGKDLEIEARDMFSRYANDVIATASFGIKCDSLNEKNNAFYTMGRKITDIDGLINTAKFLIANSAPKILEILKIPLLPKDASTYFKNMVIDTIETRERENIIRPDMIHLLIEAKKGQLKHEGHVDEDAGFATVEESHIGKSDKRKMDLSEDDLAAQALIFFFAGFETTSSIMSFMITELAINADVQKILLEEVDETFKNYGDNLTYEIIMKMKYLDHVVSETLRKWAPLFLVDRMCIRDYTIEPATEKEFPIYIRKGDMIVIPVAGIHYDSKYFPNPEKFDPDRFSDDNKSSIVPGSFLPFGVGPRNCIGSRFALLEIKVFFAHLLSKLEIVVVKRSPVPIKLSATSLNHTVDGGFWIGLKPRKL